MNAIEAKKIATEISNKYNQETIEAIDKEITKAVNKGVFFVDYSNILSPSIKRIFNDRGFRVENYDFNPPYSRISW